MRKRIGKAMLTAVICAWLLTGCGAPQEAEEGLQIVTTVFPLYDFARNVAGEDGEVTLLLKPGEETHSYEPTPQDILKIRRCDVLICVGGKSDAWLETVLASAEGESFEVVRLIDCIEPLAEEHDDGAHHEEEYDEHIWTSPLNAVAMTGRIAEALAEADPDRAAAYRSRAEGYCGELRDLDETFRRIVEQGSRRTLVFGDRFPFLYFAKEYGLSCHAAFPGCSEESEVSAATIASLIRCVREEALPAVFRIELSSGRVAESIAAETGAQVLLLHSCSNLSKDEFDRGESYLSLMKKNADALLIALK